MEIEQTCPFRRKWDGKSSDDPIKDSKKKIRINYVLNEEAGEQSLLRQQE
ncbi:hypothetical protein Syun_015391 [Stephania yunnanensis]|uniref:Uncharacterized protein n=1 Tax=Stephania yunnanensis TaxID=152371 RepID=A0AAP0PCS3_9MAGN